MSSVGVIHRHGVMQEYIGATIQKCEKRMEVDNGT